MPLDTPNESMVGYSPASPVSSVHDEDLNPPLTRTGGKKIGGRQPGATNYSLEEVHSLLELVQKFRPTTAAHWEALSNEYNRVNQYTPRTGDNLNKKFQALLKKKKVNEHGDAAPEVQLARQIALSVRSGGALGGIAEFDAHAAAQHPHSLSSSSSAGGGGGGVDYGSAEDVLRAAGGGSGSSVSALCASDATNGGGNSPFVLRKPVVGGILSSSSSSASAVAAARIANVNDVVAALQSVLEQREATRAHTHTHAALSATHGDDGPSNADLMAVLQSLSQDVKTLCELLSRRERVRARENDEENGPAAKMSRM